MLTVWCAECDADSAVSESGCLGVLERSAMGSLRWVVTDRHRRRHPIDGRRFVHGVYLEHHTRGSVDIPEFLPVRCDRHGRGSVRSDDVLAQRGNVSLKVISATP